MAITHGEHPEYPFRLSSILSVSLLYTAFSRIMFSPKLLQSRSLQTANWDAAGSPGEEGQRDWPPLPLKSEMDKPKSNCSSIHPSHPVTDIGSSRQMVAQALFTTAQCFSIPPSLLIFQLFLEGKGKNIIIVCRVTLCQALYWGWRAVVSRRISHAPCDSNVPRLDLIMNNTVRFSIDIQKVHIF